MQASNNDSQHKSATSKTRKRVDLANALPLTFVPQSPEQSLAPLVEKHASVYDSGQTLAESVSADSFASQRVATLSDGNRSSLSKIHIEPWTSIGNEPKEV